MDVRLDMQALVMAKRQTVTAPKNKEEGHTPELVEKEMQQVETQQVKTIESPPPRVISREELRDFMLILGAARGSEQLLAARAHDPQRMRDTLLAAKG